MVHRPFQIPPGVRIPGAVRPLFDATLAEMARDPAYIRALVAYVIMQEDTHARALADLHGRLDTLHRRLRMAGLD